MILTRNHDWQTSTTADAASTNRWWIASAAHLADLDERIARATKTRGVLQDAASYHLATGGKRLRGRLSIAAGLALGLEPDEFLPLAAAVELLHGASLLHDDLQDGDRERRGCEAVWSRFGKDVALLLGDAWIAAAFAEGAQTRAEAVAPVVSSLSACIASLARGQGVDTAPPSAGSWSAGAYEAMARRKTGRLFALAFELPLLAAGVEDVERYAAAVALEWLGVGYQIYDDLADLTGLKGREAGSDLRAWRMSSVLVHYAHEASSREFAALAPAEGPTPLADTSLERRVDRVLRSRALPACLLQQRGALRRSAAAARSLGEDLAGVLRGIADELETSSFRILESVRSGARAARFPTPEPMAVTGELRNPA